jgi:protein TonB
MIATAFLIFVQSAVGVAMSAPPPPSPDVARGPQAHGTAASLFSKDDYPAAAAGTGAHGKVVARLTIDTTGRVAGCTIMQSSGYGVLDQATCSILRRRARYGPGIDKHWQPVVSTVTESIVWRAE